MKTLTISINVNASNAQIDNFELPIGFYFDAEMVTMITDYTTVFGNWSMCVRTALTPSYLRKLGGLAGAQLLALWCEFNKREDPQELTFHVEANLQLDDSRTIVIHAKAITDRGEKFLDWITLEQLGYELANER